MTRIVAEIRRGQVPYLVEEPESARAEEDRRRGGGARKTLERGDRAGVDEDKGQADGHKQKPGNEDGEG